MARIPSITNPGVTGFSSLRVGPNRQARPSDVSHQVLGGTTIKCLNLQSVPLTVTAVAANTAVDLSFSIPSAWLGKVVHNEVIFASIAYPSVPAGLIFGGAQIAQNGPTSFSLVLRFANVTGSSITAGVKNFNLLIVRP